MVAGASGRVLGTDQKYVADFVSPARRVKFGRGVWAADNGCFGNWKESDFLAMLDAAEKAETKPVFVTVPDVVGDHRKTCELWVRWAPEIKRRGLRCAFVLQNGIESMHPEFALPWESLDALFIGGNDAFKLGAWVRWAVAFSKRTIATERPVWVHMGRVNSVRRMLYAQRIGCDSCDGSGMAKYADRLPLMIRFLKNQQPDLFSKSLLTPQH